MLSLIFLIGIFSFTSVYSVQNDPAAHKTLQILQMDFANKPENIQRSLLRSMALLDTQESIPFFVMVGADQRYKEEIRRDALKGLLAMDSKKYKPVLDCLQATPFDEGLIIRTLQLIEGVDLLAPFIQATSFDEDRSVVDMKISAVLKFWNKKQIESFDFSIWPSEKASAALVRLIPTSRRASQKVHLVELWSKVRDEKSTKEIVKLLDHPEFAVQEAIILALSQPGSNSVAALGRFLQKTKDATLRKRTIFALRKMNTESSKVALKSYLPKATKEEKKWIEEILSQ